MDALPKPVSLEAYRKIYRDQEIWLPAMRKICARHGYDPDTLEFAPPGTHVVFRVMGDRYIKLFAPLWPGSFTVEKVVTKRLESEPAIPSPRWLEEGEVGGWRYGVLGAVRGEPLGEVWARVSKKDRMRVAGQLGGLMHRLHALPVNGLESLGGDWEAFIGGQADRSLYFQGRRGLSATWLSEVAMFLRRWRPVLLPDFVPVLLHSDLTPDHILLSKETAGWEITGVIDFGDAMLGHPYYEFIAPSWITQDQPELQRALLLGYGYTEDEFTPALAQDLAGHVLLHRYGGLADLLNEMDPPPAEWVDFARRLWWFGK